MVRFQLNRLNDVAQLLHQAATLHELYGQKSFSFFATLGEFLKKSGDLFQREKMLSQTSKINTLSSNLVAVLRDGYDPYRHVRLDKRDTKYVVALQIFKEGQDVLLSEYEQGEEKIRQATELLESLVLSFSQQLPHEMTQFYRETCREKPAILWQSMGIEPKFALFQKKILLLVGYYDVLVLLDQIMASAFGPDIKLTPL